MANHDATEWATLYNLVMAADNDSVIYNLQELLNIFNDYPEAENLLDALESKSSKDHTHTVTAKGSVSQPTFTGTKATITISGTSKGTVEVATEAVTSSKPANYTPAGTIKAHSYTPAGSITGSQAFSGTASKTSSTAATVASSTHTHTLTAKGSISISTPGEGVTPTYTPEGTLSQPTLGHTSTNTGAAAGTTDVASQSHTHSVTGTVTISTGTGTANYTPAVSVAAPTFTG